MRVSSWGLRLTALVVLLWAPSAGAYVRSTTSAGLPIFWNRTAITTEVYLAEPPNHIQKAEVLAAVEAAAAAWSRSSLACTAFDLRVVAVDRPSAVVAADNVSRISFRREAWCKEPRAPEEGCYSPQALAVTSVFTRTSDGKILDADIEVNAVDFVWGDLVGQPGGEPRRQDLQNTLTHEIGHLLGFDHTCYVADPSNPFDDQQRPVQACDVAPAVARDSVMSASVRPGDISRRALTDDEKRAVCEVYPPFADEVTWEGPFSVVGCALAGPGDPFRPGARPNAGAWPLVGLLLIWPLVGLGRWSGRRRWRRGPGRRTAPPGRASR